MEDLDHYGNDIVPPSPLTAVGTADECRFDYPTTNGVVQNGSSVGICTHRTHVFARFGADLHAQSVLSNKISAAELWTKFVKVTLLVG